VELSRRDGALLHLAGIWQRFEKRGVSMDCVSILTTAASAEVSPVHHRMPVLLRSDAALDRWLDPNLPPQELEPFFAPAPEGTLALRPMHTRLNHWSAEGEALREADWSPEDHGLVLPPS
jgi:putative SOS response-associated peptidase YedK